MMKECWGVDHAPIAHGKINKNSKQYNMHVPWHFPSMSVNMCQLGGVNIYE